MIHYGCYDRQKTLDIKHSRFAVAFGGQYDLAAFPDSVCKPQTVRTSYATAGNRDIMRPSVKRHKAGWDTKYLLKVLRI